jgi:leucyl/phenylalanyl-tRNA--protein transferase
MPVEPPPTPWRIPAPRRTNREGLIGVGADLEPGTMLAAYRSGAFPMPIQDTLGWFSPDPRAVLPVDSVHVSRSLARSRRRFEVRVDTEFGEVVAACGDPKRPGGWITPEMRAAYDRLHELGWAHSVEVWSADGHLAGGLFGIAVGGLFAAESKFHRDTDASKVAVVALAELVAGSGDGPDRLIDVQWSSTHLASLGVVEIPRAAYLRQLAIALALPSPFAGRSDLAGP